MFQTWLILSIAALVIWGGWGLLANLTARHLGGFSALVWEVIGALMVGTLSLGWLLRNGGLETSARGATFGVLTGVTYTIGLALMFLALNQVGSNDTTGTSRGSVHTILLLTAMYPVIAVGLNYFVLNEAVTPRQLVGMGVGLTGIAILVTS